MQALAIAPWRCTCRAVRNKKTVLFKGIEQCIKRVFFPPGYAELEPSASYLASSSSGASAFFVPEQAGLLTKLLKFRDNVSCHMAQRKSVELLRAESGIRRGL